MSRADQLIDRAADRLEQLARDGASGNGVKAKLADELADDAAFLRKLKPSLIVARARGIEARDEHAPRPRAPAGPQVRHEPASEPKRGGARGGGPNPFVVAGVALVVGVALAKWIDWRGHAHPRL
jgi:hypothetical protein